MKKPLAGLLALWLLLTPALGAEVNGGYTDVPTGAWYAPHVSTCTASGVMEGVGSDTFAPDRALSLGECVVLTARLMALQNTGSSDFPTLPADLNDCVRFLDQNGAQVANFADVDGLIGNLSVVFSDGAMGRLTGAGITSLTMVLDVATFDWSAFHMAPTAPLQYTGVRVTLEAPRSPEQPYAFAFDMGTDWNGDSWEALIALDGIVDYSIEGHIPLWYRDALYYVGDRLPNYGYDALAAVENTEGMKDTATRLTFVLLAASALEHHPLTLLHPSATVPDCEDALVLQFYQAGILSGTGADNAFHGDMPLTRAQAAAIIGRILDPALRLGAT